MNVYLSVALAGLNIAPMKSLLALLSMCCWLWLPLPVAAQRPPVQLVDVYRMVGEIRSEQGHPVVVLLYGSECSLSKAMFPGFVHAAREFGPRGVKFLVFNTDGAEYGEYAGEFLRRHQAGFANMVVRRWAPGELTLAMKPLGIHVGRTWTRPLLAVFDRQGYVVHQSQGETDLRPLHSTLARFVR